MTKFKISFIEESGLDWGGLTREWLHIVKEIFGPEHGLFTYTSKNKCIIPSP